MCPMAGNVPVHNKLFLPIILLIIMQLSPPVAIVAALAVLEARRLLLWQLEAFHATYSAMKPSILFM